MKKKMYEIILGVCIVSGAIIVASLLAAPVANADDLARRLDFPGDEDNPFDDTQHLFELMCTVDIYDYCRGFDRQYKPLDERIRLPDEITEDLKRNIKYNRRKDDFGIRMSKHVVFYFDTYLFQIQTWQCGWRLQVVWLERKDLLRYLLI